MGSDLGEADKERASEVREPLLEPCAAKALGGSHRLVNVTEGCGHRGGDPIALSHEETSILSLAVI